MKDNFKFRYVNEITGMLVLGAVALLVAGIYCAGRAQGWFEKELVAYLAFAPGKGTLGLQEGAQIRILDTVAGRVGKIIPRENGSIEAKLQIKGSFQKLLHQDAVAKVKKTFTVAGDSFVELSPGSVAAGPLQNASRVRLVEEPDFMQSVSAVVQDLQTKLTPTLDDVQQILKHVNGILAQVESGQGAAGRLISDPEIGSNVTRMVQDLQKATAQLPAVASNVTAVTLDAKAISAGVAGQVGDLQGLLNQTRDTLRETERLIQAFERHWIIRNYVENPTETGMIAPSDVRFPEGGKP